MMETIRSTVDRFLVVPRALDTFLARKGIEHARVAVAANENHRSLLARVDGSATEEAERTPRTA